VGDPEAEEPNGTEPVAGASIFDPTSGRIVAAGACSPPDEVVPGSEPFCLRTPRLLEATGRTERGDVLVAGGVTLAPEHLAGVAAQIERLSPQGSSFGTSGDPSTDRREAALVAIPGGAILIGGRQGESDYLVSGLLFDESGESWELIPDLLNEECARAGAAVAVVGERILLFGGTGPDRETGVVGVRRDLEILAFSPTLRSEGCFDLDDGDVTARTGAVATAIDHRFVMVAGGVDEMGVVSDEVDVLDLENYLFCRAGVLELARYDHAAAPLPNGNVLVVGGTSGSEGHITAEVVDTSAVLSALDATGSCDELRGDELTTEQERLAQQRIAPTATLMGNDMVLVAGGFDATGNALGTCEIYVPPLL